MSTRRFAILTCMDARLDPTRLLGVPEGSAHVLRNAGGRVTDETLQALLLSHQVLGTREWFLIQHTDCGMRLSDEMLAAALSDKAPVIVTGAPASFPELRQAVVEDLARVHRHPHLPVGVRVFGYVFDVRHNQLLEVRPIRVARASASPSSAS
ncbi:carbonic anhydrase [Hymenobacter lutimineralis]|uniref:Carbonic anhydrase n=1 Tax=Hymenobacter lutimineralis TaxID=2606448 RepID=A0A5D6VDX8_9BACT|nr:MULTISPECIES: carbonic anhydrase [Hymenobacter]QIX60300.1 carbonic anhydrase [Hymenobacter sp. BT18]TYZ14281.1 carbonic anhydrase [Hymenobacter lutimineralis]